MPCKQNSKKGIPLPVIKLNPPANMYIPVSGNGFNPQMSAAANSGRENGSKFFMVKLSNTIATNSAKYISTAR